MVLSKFWNNTFGKNHDKPWLAWHDLAMLLTSFPHDMICHGFDKGTHDLARLTMIMASVL